MSKIGIIGYGFVGEATAKGFSSSKKNQVFWYDKYKKCPNTLDEVIKNGEFIFVCVPTPVYKDYSGVNQEIISSVISEVAPKISGTEKVLIIKSTSLPGSLNLFIKKYPKVNFATNPEFLTQKNANKDFLNPSRTIIGVKDKKVGERVRKLYETILPKDQKYFITDPVSAELAKYMSNLMLASKILIANEFYDVAVKTGANYDDVYKMVEADPRIGSHLKVPGTDGDRGFGGACFPKDMVGLISFAKTIKVDTSALNAVWEKNLKIRKVKDWEEMDNAFGRGSSKK